MLSFVVSFKAGSPPVVAQAGLKLPVILLPQPSRCLKDRRAPPYPAPNF